MMNRFNISLEGRFVRIERLKIEHLADLEKQFDPTLFDYYPMPYATAQEFVEENLEMEGQASYVPFVIKLASSGEAIGCTEFSAIDLKNRKLEIGGSWLKNSFHRTAANSETKYLLLKHVFQDLEFVRVQFATNVLNKRSRSALEKIGAKFEGILRNAMILPDGTLRDDAYYSVISSEWPSTKELLETRIEGKLNHKYNPTNPKFRTNDQNNRSSFE